MIRLGLLLPLALGACSDGGEATRPEYQLISATRQGLYAVKAAPGGALASFSDVRLYSKDVVCGTVDAQDGGGTRHFAVKGGGAAVIERSDDPQAPQKIADLCRGPARKVTSRNAGYTDLEVDRIAR